MYPSPSITKSVMPLLNQHPCMRLLSSPCSSALPVSDGWVDSWRAAESPKKASLNLQKNAKTSSTAGKTVCDWLPEPFRLSQQFSPRNSLRKNLTKSVLWNQDYFDWTAFRTLFLAQRSKPLQVRDPAWFVAVTNLKLVSCNFSCCEVTQGPAPYPEHTPSCVSKNEYHCEKNKAGKQSPGSKWTRVGSFCSIFSLCGTANRALQNQNDTRCHSHLEITERSQTHDLLLCWFALFIDFICNPLTKWCKFQGLFMYLIAANGNRYEGSWKDGKKHGPGKYIYSDKGQLLEGIWVADVPKCGVLVDFDRDGAPASTEFPLPEVIAWKLLGLCIHQCSDQLCR